jgi:hypothetical protein
MTASSQATDLLSGPVGSVVRGAFERMGVAEEELDRARLSHRSDLFLALCPEQESMSGAAMWVYRAHARELCERARRGEDLRPATLAEIALGMMRASLKSPLDSMGQAVYEHAMVEVLRLGDGPASAFDAVLGDVGPTREPWEGATREHIEDLRRKMQFKRGAR